MIICEYIALRTPLPHSAIYLRCADHLKFYSREKFGGARRNRTDDLFNAMNLGRPLNQGVSKVGPTRVHSQISKPVMRCIYFLKVLKI
jgi:hypothetical protein